GAVLGPFMAVEAGLAARHDFIEIAAEGNGEVELGQIAPAAILAGVALARRDIAIFIAARLGPQAVQGEIGGFKAVGALTAAVGFARAEFGEGGLPIDREDILGAAIGGRGWRRCRFVDTALGVGGAGAAFDGYPTAVRCRAGDDNP